MMIWQDRNMSECFKVFYVKLYVYSLVDKLKWFYENALCYNKIYKKALSDCTYHHLSGDDNETAIARSLNVKHEY